MNNVIKKNKKDFTENKPKKDKNQALEFAAEEDKCTKVSEDMSLSRFSISILRRLQRKLRFQEGEKELPRTPDIVRFFIVITL